MTGWNDIMARDAIIRDPTLGLLEKSRRLADWSLAAQQEPSPPSKWTLGDVFHGAIGAALGAGMARGVSNILGLSPRTADKLETAAMGIGAAMNTGHMKRAFRLGCLRALVDQGYFEKQAAIPTMNLSPTSLLEIPRSIARAITQGGDIAGTAYGLSSAVDEDDEDIAKLQVERAMLEEQIERIRAEREDQIVRQILKARRPKGY